MSFLTDLMAVRPVTSADPSAAGSSAPRGVYVTKESLTFTAANGVVLALLTVLNTFVPDASTDKLWMLGACVFVGVVIYLLSVTPAMTAWDKFTGGLIALINTFILFGTVVGVLSLPPASDGDADTPSPAAIVSS